MTWNEISPGSGVYRCEYDTGAVLANSLVLGLGDGKIAVISPSSAADDQHFAATEALGEVVALIAPSSGHDMGQKSWQERYPDAGVFAPTEALDTLNKLGLRAFRSVTALPVPDGVEVVEAPGTKTGALMVRSTRGERSVVYIDEVIGNNRALPSGLMFKTLFWLTGSAPGLKVNKVYGMVFTKDQPALMRAASELIDDDSVVCCAHGELTDGASVKALLTA